MNVYDFDETIYDGDCSKDFVLFCIKKNKKVLLIIPKLALILIKYIFGFVSKEKAKETIFSFLKYFDNIDLVIEEFWVKHKHKIKDFYLKQKKDDDLVISASPEFLIIPITKQLNIKALASKIDVRTGLYDGLNCHGQEKVVRFKKLFPNSEIQCFYSDSYADDPLAQIAQKAIMVSKDNLMAWEAKRSLKSYQYRKLFLSKAFICFLFIGVINTFNGVFTAYLYSLILDNANLAFILGYLTALSIAYVLNSYLIFKEKLDIQKYIKFGLSYIPNFIIQNIIVFIVYNWLKAPSILAYVLAAILGIPITFILVKFFAFSNGGKQK